METQFQISKGSSSNTKSNGRAALVGYHGEPLWRDTRRDPLASCSGELLGGIHWRAALGILGGIHWRAALAGYWVGVWCRSIANADSNIKSKNPFLSGGEKDTNQNRKGRGKTQAWAKTSKTSTTVRALNSQRHSSAVGPLDVKFNDIQPQ